MRKLIGLAGGLICLFLAPAAFSQGIQINPENRTISVSATESVAVEPQIARVRIGLVNSAPTQKAAFDQNARVAAKVIESLLKGGVSKSQIQTFAVRLERLTPRQYAESSVRREGRKHRGFQATQTWIVRVRVAEAQAVVDRAVAAGANEVLGVDWRVADPDALEAKANAAALEQAGRLARQMAAKFGGKVGELLYASNSTPPYVGRSYGMGRGFGGGRMAAVAQRVSAATPRLALRLFPRKVRQTSTVYAVFALK